MINLTYYTKIVPNFNPIDAFMLLFTEKLFELICEQTNIYGQQNNKNWTIINISDIKI